MTMHRPGAAEPREAGALARCLIDLAETPDDAADLQNQLVTAAVLTADRVDAADYASMTAWRDSGYVTVAASAELARAVDEAQYADGAGPCLDSVDTGSPVPVPDIRSAIRWPGFRDEAYRVGLRASLSIPLFAGSGAPIAALNLYGRDAVAMAALIEAVLAVFGVESGAAGDPPEELDEGGRELIAGLIGAHDVRATIQRGIGVIIGRESCTVDEGYRALRDAAAETGATLSQTATGVQIEQA
jgi:hypothetical protein